MSENKKLTAWDVVQIARDKNRPLLCDYIDGICTNFIELHGDRRFGDDKGIIGGFATIGDNKVMLIGHLLTRQGHILDLKLRLEAKQKQLH
jgi:acetyl-CoA carboxylase carboxyl transferase subunit alpha